MRRLSPTFNKGRIDTALVRAVVDYQCCWFQIPVMERKTCFIISPLGEPDSPQRKRANTVLKFVFKPALEPLGYELVRADEISQPGSITLQILERVIESEMVVADLTDHNPNVFYELAVRHASQKPVIHVIASDQKIPFDVADMRTIGIETDLEGAERSRAQISAQAQEIEAGHFGENPVKLANVIRHLATGKSDDKLILRQILDALTEMRADIRASSLEQFSRAIFDGKQTESPRLGFIGKGDKVTAALTEFDLKEATELVLREVLNMQLLQYADAVETLEQIVGPDGSRRFELITKLGNGAAITVPFGTQNCQHIAALLLKSLSRLPDRV
ncbi:MAG: hypothetical protein LAO78_27685 [Acidobacteriia bacterium]|nr:hypothetical protein [Terriglobia bacterium]